MHDLQRRLRCIVTLLSIAALLGAADASGSPRPVRASDETGWEIRFDANISASAIRDRLRIMSSAPSPIGSPHNKANAEFTLRDFRTWGWDAHIERFDVLYPTPSTLSLTLIGPKPFRASLQEPPVPGDRTSTTTKDVMPSYLVYGSEGDVTASLVYVNYGFEDDYDELARIGVSVRGKIVIARFGGGWRGLKPKLAYEHGAVGCILYSDPADDGYAQGDVYPKGPRRPSRSVQRGSIIDLPVRPGDPLSGQLQVKAGKIAADSIVKIPAIAISYADADHFLRALGGRAVKPAWRGALPFTYHVGPGPAKARLVVKLKWARTPLYNVIATLKGSVWPDQWILRGNNRDTWIFGAWDSLSGHSAMMEEARAIGALVKSGWKPRRTIVYASWDGEEAGLLGSVAWAAKHEDALKRSAVLYVNTGPYGRGIVSAGASYSAIKLIDRVAAEIRDPETGASVRDRAVAVHAVQQFAANLPIGGHHSSAMPVEDLGAGSDYASFLQHLGIPAIDIGIGGENVSYSVAHSIYDSFDYFSRFSDPTGAYGAVLAKLAGRLVLRAASSEILPFEFGELAARVGQQATELRDLVDDIRRQTDASNALVRSNAFKLAADPAEKTSLPHLAPAVPLIDFSSLLRATAKLEKSARAYDSALSQHGAIDGTRRDALNAILQGMEQTFIEPRGLPGRPWYRHLLYEPGLKNGYVASTLPGIRGAIEGRRWPEAREYLERTARVLEECANRIDRATRLLAPRSTDSRQ